MKFFRYSAVILFFIVQASCKKEVFTGNTVAAVNQTNIAYGTDPQQKMDLYLPPDRTMSTTKVMVMIHGGSWTGGDKNDLAAYMDSLKKRLPSYAIFNINYRLSASPYNVFPTQENDVKAALDFIHSKSAEYLISDKYALIGVSAGAHLAMLQGFKYSSPIKAKAVASFSGPADLIEMYNHPVGGNIIISLALAQAVGTTPMQNSLLYTTSSPVNFITDTSPPTILFQGGTDPLVSATQAMEVQTKLTNAGVINQYVFYPDAAHIGFWDNATMYDAFNKLQTFIEKNVL